MSGKPWVGKTVVIIDDSAGVRSELKEVFTACGMKVVAMAENGVVGLEQVQSLRPELASIDIIMPEMDGVECYRKIQALGGTTKCLMVSWLGGDAKIQENLRELIPSHLFQSKPVSVMDLEARLMKVYFPDRVEKAPGKGDEAKAKEVAPPEDFFDDLGVKVS